MGAVNRERADRRPQMRRSMGMRAIAHMGRGYMGFAIRI